MRNDQPLLHSILQKGLDSIGPKEQDAIYEKWVRLEFDTRVDYSKVLPAFIGISIILLLVILYTLRLRALHVGFVRVDDEKMSKSLNNFFTIREVLKDYHPEVIRYFLLSSHYRSPLNYSQENLQAAKTNLARLYTALEAQAPGLVAKDTEFETRFNAAMEDDFNTPLAISVLFELVKEVNKTKQADLVALLQSLANRLGLLMQTPEDFFKGTAGEALDGLSDADIEALIAERAQARQDKNWARSDQIRDQLLADGVELLDSAQGTSWRRQ